MDDLSPPDDETLIAGRADWIGADAAARLTRHPLDGVDTEYPHATGAIEGPDDVTPPRERHPVFYGCFDWHSAVHSHWCLVRALRLFPDHPDREAIAQGIDERLTAEHVAGELAWFENRETFERPYGWAWLLALAAELDRWDDPRAARWGDALAPLEERVRDLVVERFLPMDRPFRVGTHGNSAFALSVILDYARSVGDDALERSVVETALAFYRDDADASIGNEPLGWDFLSPALAEADLMRRVLDGDAFATWADGFLPDADTLPAPVSVADGEDGVALHLVGLNVSRAWALAGVADALPAGSRRTAIREAAVAHARRGVEEAFTDDYAGSHWLSSFVCYLLTREEGGIGPVA
ncbi:DUF2891 domain-containing protein [Halobaculum magnesiiphilum]|uniref:DUF2891 domain-containing protein n=1 Tax=Halobaculum magnesiiphilum TaxID=1017351 RepID=A0A8T8WED1_9EURY|nr:DUF2891 domain-containing protein [Halobaculum magnesiiphilum]QZP38136.1 DUF2891 domain-containing protein [Halobaculum magnesiiphilum]